MTAIELPKRFVRSWKERWDKDAPLLFVKKVRLNLPGMEFSVPGAVVSPELRKLLGPHKLKIWWTARIVSRVDSLLVPPKAESSAPSAFVPPSFNKKTKKS